VRVKPHSLASYDAALRAASRKEPDHE
jgi:hypothetical protein